MSDDLGYIREALGRIEQKIDGHSVTVAAHVAHDEVVQKALFERIENLQLSHASQRGSAKTWAAVATGAGAIVGAVAPALFKRFFST